MTAEEINALWDENTRRNRALHAPYNPLSGDGCIGSRAAVVDPSGALVKVPEAMLADCGYERACAGGMAPWEKLRAHYDFEFWAARCVRITDKRTARTVPFTLNAPQRRVAGLLERDRLAHKPIRMILLKARQWGGSTLVQMYMAWLQCVHCQNWHSIICAHVKDTSSTIRGMYSQMLSNYPEELWDGDKPPKFEPFERTINARLIAGRGCRVMLASAQTPESVRGGDFKMAHLSEVAFWPSTPRRGPDDLVRSVCGSINYDEMTLIVMESTANGVGNFFHTEWLRAQQGQSDKRAVFVPWHEIEIYRRPVSRDQVEPLWLQFDQYERELWQQGVTLESLCWYHHKRREYASHSMMQAEYPSNPVEAFANTGHNVFALSDIEALRASVESPRLIGEVRGNELTGSAALLGVRFVPSELGGLKIWSEPRPGESYVVSVDIGGRSDGADWSVIAVMSCSPVPRVVAQWRGHVDHDILTWKSAAIATYYNEALLVIESNTLETEGGDSGALLSLSLLRREYRNLYRRETYDSLSGQTSTRVGFHTNRSTKSLVINTLIGLVRDKGYVERDAEALNELATYEMLPNGSYAARRGCHDDILMTRAIGLYVALHTPGGSGYDPADLRSAYTLPTF